jgi:DNA repair protein RadD
VEARWYQAEANQAAWQYISDGRGNPLIVLPTGAGKSIVIALLIRQAVEWGQRVLVVAHRKELLQQNADKIYRLTGLKVGINSAGLNERDIDSTVICAGIQSVYRDAAEFGKRGLVVIDEAHLISDDGGSMYRQFLDGLQQHNRRLFCVGLTATPYRTGEGSLAGDGKLFSGVCYEAKTGALIEGGFLSKLTNNPADSQADLKGVKVRGGEFVAAEMEAAFTHDAIIHAAVCELTIACEHRKSILVFCAGVSHAEQVALALRDLTGQDVGLVTGETHAMERQRVLSDFRNGTLRWCVNVDVLTTGFDAPGIDAVAVLRATMSPGLFAQIVGRGLRISQGKTDCLILDFGGNLQRHGALDADDYGISKPRNSDGSEAPSKVCPKCKQEVYLSAVKCSECGHIFVRQMDQTPRHGDEIDTTSSIVGAPEPQWYDVQEVNWHLHAKKNTPGKPPTLCVSYYVSDDTMPAGNLGWIVVREWVCFEHEGFALSKAFAWWDARSLQPFPASVAEAITALNHGSCRKPSRLLVKREGQWDRIVQAEFSEEKPTMIRELTTAVNEFGEDCPF